MESLLAASGLGAGSGIAKIILNMILEGIQDKREQNKLKIQADRDVTISAINANQKQQQELYSKKYEEVEIDNESKFAFLLFGKEFGWSSKSKKDKLVINPVVSAYAFSFRLLVVTLAWITFIWADGPSEVIATLNPSAEPYTIGILWDAFTFHIPVTEVLQLSTTGLANALIHLIAGIVVHLMVVSGTEKALKK